MKVSLKARNVPKLAVFWLGNIAVFPGVATYVFDVWDVEAMWTFLSELARNPWAGLPYAGLLILVSIFNGPIRRPLKERLVFWPESRPGCLAFSDLMFKDSTIDRKALEEGRVASITGQARSTLTRENGQPTDSNLAQPSSVILLRARTPICASVF